MKQLLKVLLLLQGYLLTRCKAGCTISFDNANEDAALSMTFGATDVVPLTLLAYSSATTNCWGLKVQTYPTLAGITVSVDLSTSVPEMTASPSWPSGHFSILASIEDEFGEVYRTLLIDRVDSSIGGTYDYSADHQTICEARCDHKYRDRVPEYYFLEQTYNTQT